VSVVARRVRKETTFYDELDANEEAKARQVALDLENPKETKLKPVCVSAGPRYDA
jgi:hypothetical protein